MIGIDFGSKRIGIAIGDTEIGLAVPQDVYINKSIESSADYIVRKAIDTRAEAIVIGIPYSMSGKVGPQADLVIAFIEILRARTDLPVESVDERLSTTVVHKIAKQQLSKDRGRKRKISIKTDELDSSAAAVILQSWMDYRSLNENTF